MFPVLHPVQALRGSIQCCGIRRGADAAIPFHVSGGDCGPGVVGRLLAGQLPRDPCKSTRPRQSRGVRLSCSNHPASATVRTRKEGKVNRSSAPPQTGSSIGETRPTLSAASIDGAPMSTELNTILLLGSYTGQDSFG